MKTLSKIVLLAAIIFAPKLGFSQDAKEETVSIKTSAICGMCESNIKKALKKTEGVKGVTLDKKSKVVTVAYFADKTNPEKIRQAISLAGYDADSLQADPKAYSKLQDCCKKNNKPH